MLFASSPSGELAPIKVLERTSNDADVMDSEIRTCEQVTIILEKWDDSERILRVVEVLYSNWENFSSNRDFDVAIVLKLKTPQTFVDVVGVWSKR